MEIERKIILTEEELRKLLTKTHEDGFDEALERLRQEVIKHIKALIKTSGEIKKSVEQIDEFHVVSKWKRDEGFTQDATTVIKWLKHSFNINEEELK